MALDVDIEAVRGLLRALLPLSCEVFICTWLVELMTVLFSALTNPSFVWSLDASASPWPEAAAATPYPEDDSDRKPLQVGVALRGQDGCTCWGRCKQIITPPPSFISPRPVVTQPPVRD